VCGGGLEKTRWRIVESSPAAARMTARECGTRAAMDIHIHVEEQYPSRSDSANSISHVACVALVIAHELDKSG
jgi:hypothetical protein